VPPLDAFGDVKQDRLNGQFGSLLDQIYLKVVHSLLCHPLQLLGSFSTNVLVPLWVLAVFLYKYSLSSGSIFYISFHSHMGKVHFDQFFYLSVHFGSLVLVFLLLFEVVFRFLFLLLLFRKSSL